MAPHVHVEKCGVSVEGPWTSALQPLHRCLPSLPERWGVSTRNQAFWGEVHTVHALLGEGQASYIPMPELYLLCSSE